VNADWFTLSFQFQLPMFKISQVQVGSGIRRVADKNLAWASLGREPRSNVDIITQRSEICRIVLASYYADKGRAGMDADSYWKPRALQIAMTSKSKRMS
jgi:hypothetical protein